MLNNPRMRRLFDHDGKCFDVALDHGVFHTPEFLAGIEDLPRAVETLVEAAPDAIQLGPGQAHLLQSRPGRSKPAAATITRARATSPASRRWCGRPWNWGRT